MYATPPISPTSRYRERKKQKYCSLQGTVEELTERLERLSALESSAAALTARNQGLEGLAADQRRALDESGAALARQQEQLRIAADTIVEQQRLLREREERVAALEGRLEGLQRHAAAAVAAAAAMDKEGAASGRGSGGAGEGAGEATTEALAAAVRAVLGGLVAPIAAAASGVGSASAAAASPAAAAPVLPLPDAVLQQIRCCCAEVAVQLRSLRVVQKEQPQTIQVPCC